PLPRLALQLRDDRRLGPRVIGRGHLLGQDRLGGIDKLLQECADLLSQLLGALVECEIHRQLPPDRCPSSLVLTRRMPANQRSRSPARRRSNSATCGCGRIRKRPSANAAITASATSVGSIIGPAARVAESAPSVAVMGVRTACGHRHVKRTPLSPYRIASHSASATDPCLVTAYGAVSISVRSPAAEAVTMKCPRPRRTIAGNTCRAA